MPQSGSVARGLPPQWRSAAGTGAGAGLSCAILGIVAVAITWLPVSGGSDGRIGSTISAGLLTYLAGLHGGLTVDGTFASWIPLGMTLIAALVCRRAGRSLAAVCADETDGRVLVRTGLVQVAGFTVVALLAVPFATLGTSSASAFRVGFAAVVLCAVCAGIPFVRGTALRQEIAALLPPLTGPVLRAAAAALVVYLGAGALLVAGSLLIHHDRVGVLARGVGGGWGTVPILVLCVLAAPNAAIAGAGYLAGPGFAVGGDTVVSATASTHGVLPAFPVLGAVPSAPANPVVWAAMALTFVAAGAAGATVLARTQVARWWHRFGLAAAAAVVAAVGGMLAAWLAAGGIGSGGLATIGVPVGWFGLFLAGIVLVGTSVALGLVSAGRAVRMRFIDRAEADLAFELPAEEDEDEDARPTLALVSTDEEEPVADDDKDQLAG